MDILNASNLYGWFTALIRRPSRRKTSNDQTAESTATAVQLIGSASQQTVKFNGSISTETACATLNNPLENHQQLINIEMDPTTKNPKSPKSPAKSDENSIEEDIEELIGSVSSENESSFGKSHGKVNELFLRKKELFDIDPGGGDNRFSIDDDDLSGGMLAQHFQQANKETSAPTSIKTFEAESKSHIQQSQEGEEEEEEEEFENSKSNPNQSTAADVSDMQENESLSSHQGQLYTRSLEFTRPLTINYEDRKYRSLDTTVDFLRLIEQQSGSYHDTSIEQDHSLEEIMASNHSIEITLNPHEFSSLDPNIDINNESQMNNILNETKDVDDHSIAKNQSDRSQNTTETEENEEDMKALKQKIMSLNEIPKIVEIPFTKDIHHEHGHSSKTVIDNSSSVDDSTIVPNVKQMERIQVDFSKEILEDITEESEKLSAINEYEKTSGDFDSIVSLNMIQMLENKVKDLEDVVAEKNVCLASLNLQLDTAQRKESIGGNNESRVDSLRELPPSGRDSSSLATTSTEYRTIQEDLGAGNKLFDLHTELSQRDNLIEKLTDSLQQSMSVREQLQQQSEKLSLEVLQLRRQLTDTLDALRKPCWPRDQESTGQRLSEISIDLVSESDDDLDRQFSTDNEERMSTSNRNSRERQLFDPMFDLYDPEAVTISKQIEQFQKYLNPDELRIFFMVQKKFDDFLSQEIEKSKMKYDGEIKQLAEQLENEKHERESEIDNLRQMLTSVRDGSTELLTLRQELETIHAREMESLRTYFEKKCADLEKHYSEEVFSQKSQRNSCDTNSDISDQENLPDEIQGGSKEPSPRKRTREEIYASPTHRQMTPTTISQSQNEPSVVTRQGSVLRSQDREPDISPEELKTFYQEKIREIKHNHEEAVKKLNEKLKKFETKYADDEFMKTQTIVEDDRLEPSTSSYLIVDVDDINNESQEIKKIAAEYERRLQEQVALAKEDILHELEAHIQALLSETATDDQHWPPELILLREKFTAKSQLEIAQLQIKHEEEMSRIKIDYEKQLNRKLRRNSNFDLSRDLDQIVNERDNLRELSNTFRWLLSELVKCVTVCEDDLNNTLIQELQKHGLYQQNKEKNQSLVEDFTTDRPADVSFLSSSIQSIQQIEENLSKRIRFVPDVSGLLTVIEDPSLVEWITTNNRSFTSFNLSDCLEKLRHEANYLLELSENLYKKKGNESIEIGGGGGGGDSCEEEDGLKSASKRSPQKVLRTCSLNENLLRDNPQSLLNVSYSLPPDISRITLYNDSVVEEIFSSTQPSSELSFQVHELKNRLVKSEGDRKKLQNELEITITKNKELGIELNALREQLEQCDSQKELYCESYGQSQLKSPPRVNTSKTATTLSELQEKARNFLSTPTKSMNENMGLLVQLIEEFCREGDHFVEEGKKDREDLQSQIDAADKQLKATRQFLEDQAAERELERDEFTKEIEILKNHIRDKEKERRTFEIASNEVTKILRILQDVEQMENKIKDLTQQVEDHDTRKHKLETELKASIDKIYSLREIISKLETQLEMKNLNENTLNEKIKELVLYISTQNLSNETLQHEVESLKTEIGHDYQEKIARLEEQLKNARPDSEQNVIIGKIAEQIRDIETTIEQKTKTLESLHQAVCSNSCSTSPSEDVSVQVQGQQVVTPQASPVHTQHKHLALPIDEVQRVFEKLAKHTRVEEAAIKRIRDLEMQVGNIRSINVELQHERDILQERMSEQLTRISSLQSKLDEQRHRAEELQRQGSSELAIRIHDLQSEVRNLKETLSVRDKQINNLKNHLEQSKTVIDRQEAEIAVGIQGDRSAMDKLEAELKNKSEENRKLKEKIKHEMINKLALPDLMETMLADKNEEIDHLKEQLQAKEKELQGILEINLSQVNNSEKDQKSSEEHEAKHSARTLSDIVSISEYDEPDIIRRAAVEVDSPLLVPHGHTLDKTMESSKEHGEATSSKPVGEIFAASNSMALQAYAHPNYFQNPLETHKENIEITPTFVPRQINFSEFIDDSRMKGSTPKIEELHESDDIKELRSKLKISEDQIESLKISLENIETEKTGEIEHLKIEIAAKTQMYDELLAEKRNLDNQIEVLNKKFSDFEEILKGKENELVNLMKQTDDNNTHLIQFQEVLSQKAEEISELKHKINKLTSENTSLTNKTKNTNSLNTQIESLTKKIDDLQSVIKEKDEILSKQEKNLLNFQQNEKDLKEKLQKLELNSKESIDLTEKISNLELELNSANAELNLAKAELSEKVLLYENCLLDIRDYESQVKKLKENAMPETDTQKQLSEEIERNSELQQRNSALESELEKLRSQNSDNSKPFSLDEIAEQVEKELNYSAQLDSNILKAIESEEENNLDTQFKTDSSDKQFDKNIINELQLQLEIEKNNLLKVQSELIVEKQHSQDIKEQDADIIEAMRLRLQAAIEKEQDLQKVLDEEREKCERLATHISVLQRSEARRTSLLLRSPPDSPRKSPRSGDESDTSERYKNELKLLSAQNDRERERVVDLQKVLEREKNRFETELSDRIDYSEKLKKEMEKLSREKDDAEFEVEHLRERLRLTTTEIENLESRISALQETETRRAQRRGRERNETTQNTVELQELRLKVTNLESERNHLNQTVAILRNDIDRGAKREAKLAEALASSGNDSSIPEQFLQKLKEMNYLLMENKQENQQMSDTLKFLTNERKSLQSKCNALEAGSQNYAASASNIQEMEERANHLFGKYLRVESHRKALVHQKRYLLIVLRTLQDNENKTLALLNVDVTEKPKRKSFKCVVLVVIAIERMKFIVKRWQAGKRIASKSIFKITSNIMRPPSAASTNYSQPSSDIGTSSSPPCRDRPQSSRPNRLDSVLKPLQSPGLIKLKHSPQYLLND